MSNTKPYSVIGFYEESNKYFCHHIKADNRPQALYLISQKHESAIIVAAINGYLQEGINIDFSGESLVDSETILSQPEVFNIQGSEKSHDLVSLADFEIKDLYLQELGDQWKGPDHHKDTYRCVIEQSPLTKQTYFKVYPKALDQCTGDIALNGLAGVIEIRNGKPGISLGTDENELPVHLESDIRKGLYLHCDDETDKNTNAALFYSFDHGMDFPARFYQCAEQNWLMNARTELANKAFESHDFGSLIVADSSGWKIEEENWRKPVFFESPNGGDSLKGYFNLRFAQGSILIQSISSS